MFFEISSFKNKYEIGPKKNLHVHKQTHDRDKQLCVISMEIKSHIATLQVKITK